eukprot:jgi/Picsp_1/1528/NSC_05006-R1_n-ethylmaleimide sensitive fusion protein
MFELQVVTCPSQDLAKTNCVFVGSGDPAANVISGMIHMGDFIFTVRTDSSLMPGMVGLNAIQRRLVKVSTGDKILCTPYEPPIGGSAAAVITAEIDYVSKKTVRGPDAEFNAQDLIEHLTSRFAGQVLTVHQQVTFEYQGVNYVLAVKSIIGTDTDSENLTIHRGQLLKETEIVFETRPGSGIKVVGQRTMASTQLFKQKEFNFEKLGIGGLDAQFEKIFRRAFASRIFPPAMLDRLGIHHVKGVLLYGPPGTGKTLIARQIGKMLNGKEPKIVNGPEILSKYVGASEENIRDLFKEAEEEYKRMGDASELHVVIFDEIDAICKQRGSVNSGTGVHDTVVNQLLTKIDGVDALNNILLIGMTNRKDMLDDALLRPGRLEVQVEIGLPDDRGRLQILQIHTAKMLKHSFLADDVDLYELARITKNFSGAELEGLVKSAASFALNRQIDVNDLSKTVDEENIKICMEDFKTALEEVIPAFGATVELLDSFRLHGMADYGARYQQIMSSCKTLVRQVENSENNPLVTALLEGPAGSGKTAIAATVAIESGFPFVKVVSAESMIGMSESAKCSYIARIFDDAYKTILVLLKKTPPEGRRLCVLGTSSLGLVMQDMDISSTFNVEIHVPQLSKFEMREVLHQQRAFSPAQVDIAVQEVPEGTSIKRLLLLLDLARQGLPPEQMEVPIENWTKVINDLL